MIRIISGKYKNSNLSIPNGEKVRPTSSIKRDSLFNILSSKFLKLGIENFFSDKIILDCFAGSGALGIEALSRGGKFCFFIEKNKKVYLNLKKNCEIIPKKKYGIINSDFLKINHDKLKIDKSIDIFFIDPPYSFVNINTILDNIFLAKIHNKNSVFIIETKKETKIKEYKNLKIFNERVFGKTKISFLNIT